MGSICHLSFILNWKDCSQKWKDAKKDLVTRLKKVQVNSNIEIQTTMKVYMFLCLVRSVGILVSPSQVELQVFGRVLKPSPTPNKTNKQTDKQSNKNEQNTKFDITHVSTIHIYIYIKYKHTYIYIYIFVYHCCP